MTAWRRLVGVGAGIGLIGVGLGITAVGVNHRPIAVLVIGLTVVTGLIGLAMRFRGQPRSSEGALPWSDTDRFAHPAPERSSRSDALSSDRLVHLVQEAGDAARSNRDLEAGVSVVRPELRETLTAVLEVGGHEPDESDQLIADGEWTDDDLAAWLVSGEVPEPDESLRRRVRRWLSPERELRDRTHRAVAAIAQTAEEQVPAIPGQRAPRPVPVVTPRIEELQQDLDGSFTRASDPDQHGGEPR